jgi:hypothetical protein
VIPAARKGLVGSGERRWGYVIEINIQYVGVCASTLSHVPAIPLVAGVINADRRPRPTGDVRLLTGTPSFQGSALSTAIQVRNAGGMGFDKYRTGSRAPGLGG